MEKVAKWNKLLARYSLKGRPFSGCLQNEKVGAKFLEMVVKGPPVQFR